MRVHLALPAVFATLWPLCGAAAMADPASPLVGSWRLERYVDLPEGGEPVYALGRAPVGQMIFTADGHASISLMRNPPEAVPGDDPATDSCVPAWYCAYFGTYTLDPSGRRWTVQVQGGNMPAYRGTTQSRDFEISGDRLTIRAAYEQDGRRFTAERVFVRAGAG